MHGNTSKDVYPTRHSHVNLVVVDSGWEAKAAKILDDLVDQGNVLTWVKNAFLGFRIPYIDEKGKERDYMPDFIVRLKTEDGSVQNLIVEVSGTRFDKEAKLWTVRHRWLPAVNAVADKHEWDRWDFLELDSEAAVKDLANLILPFTISKPGLVRLPKSPKAIKSYKHKAEKRAHLPSSEEAGYEDANPQVKTGTARAEFPRNPIVHRGQDPELFWKSKYGESNDQDTTTVDIRSLYRHEHIAPEQIIRGLYKIVESNPDQSDLFRTNELFGNALKRDELEKVSDYYIHSDGWTNRLIQGDSQIVMSSLLEREGMAGQVQCIYIDPPYGIEYGSNWQIKLNNLSVGDTGDDSLSGEPEQIKAFRDTWELGIHSYLNYLRDRLLVARELLHESGSCFVQISDENVHLVRCLMDEVFGSANFICTIVLKKKGNQKGGRMEPINDYILWTAKNRTVKLESFSLVNVLLMIRTVNFQNTNCLTEVLWMPRRSIGLEATEENSPRRRKLFAQILIDLGVYLELRFSMLKLMGEF